MICQYSHGLVVRFGDGSHSMLGSNPKRTKGSFAQNFTFSRRHYYSNHYIIITWILHIITKQLFFCIITALLQNCYYVFLQHYYTIITPLLRIIAYYYKPLLRIITYYYLILHIITFIRYIFIFSYHYSYYKAIIKWGSPSQFINQPRSSRQRLRPHHKRAPPGRVRTDNQTVPALCHNH